MLDSILELEPDTVITAGVGVGVIPVGPPAQFVNTLQINGQIVQTVLVLEGGEVGQHHGEAEALREEGRRDTGPLVA